MTQDLEQLLSPASRGQELYILPLGLQAGPAAGPLLEAGLARPLAGGPAVFTMVEIAVRHGPGLARVTVPVGALDRGMAGEAASATLGRLCAPRRSFAGLTLPAVMGIVNVTPDSFSDGGERLDPPAAVAAGLEMVAAGAALVDVGGESTRPGAEPVPEDEELRRVLPVVAGLATAGVRVSVDTRRAGVMRAALDAGAILVNDVTALAGDAGSVAAVRDHAAPAVLMHMQGEPQTMQAAPRYGSVLHDVYDYLGGRLDTLSGAGLPRQGFAVDPGIGFGKTVAHNLAILRGLGLFLGLGVPLLVGLSRKGFIGRIAGDGAAARDRLGGSLAGALWALDHGASILRVHDVAETVQAIALWRALAAGEVA